MAAPHKDPISQALKAVSESARRGATGFEADRRYRQCLENVLVGEHGFTPEQAQATVEKEVRAK
jgi:hypothetical protein